MTPNQLLHALETILDDWEMVGQYDSEANEYILRIQELWQRYQEEGSYDIPNT